MVSGSKNHKNREWVYIAGRRRSAARLQRAGIQSAPSRTPERPGHDEELPDCHLSKTNDNNAWMTSCSASGPAPLTSRPLRVVGGEGGLLAWSGTESMSRNLQLVARFRRSRTRGITRAFSANGRKLKTAYEHRAREINDMTCAEIPLYRKRTGGPRGLFDGGEHRPEMASASGSSLARGGVSRQRTYVRNKFATSVARCRAPW